MFFGAVLPGDDARAHRRRRRRACSARHARVAALLRAKEHNPSRALHFAANDAVIGVHERDRGAARARRRPRPRASRGSAPRARARGAEVAIVHVDDDDDGAASVEDDLGDGDGDEACSAGDRAASRAALAPLGSPPPRQTAANAARTAEGEEAEEGEDDDDGPASCPTRRRRRRRSTTDLRAESRRSACSARAHARARVDEPAQLLARSSARATECRACATCPAARRAPRPRAVARRGRLRAGQAVHERATAFDAPGAHRVVRPPQRDHRRLKFSGQPFWPARAQRAARTRARLPPLTERPTRSGSSASCAPR